MNKEKLSSRSGFTLVELLIFSAIFGVVAIMFITVLVSITNIQARQTGLVEVNQQSQFLLQTIQSYVQQSSLIEMTTGLPGNRLTLRMSSSSQDKTEIYLNPANGMVYLEQAGGIPQPLTTDKVTVSSMQFIKRSNPPGHDTASVSFSMAFVTENPKQKFSKALQTAVVRVSAATFDSNIVPPSTASNLSLGVSGSAWNSINDTIFFDNTNRRVGIGPSIAPNERLELDGGLRLNPVSVGKPSCDGSKRGTLWFSPLGVATDTLEVCLKDGLGSYGWAQVY